MIITTCDHVMGANGESWVVCGEPAVVSVVLIDPVVEEGQPRQELDREDLCAAHLPGGVAVDDGVTPYFK